MRTSLATYREAGLVPSLAENSNDRKMCEKLMALFSLYDSRINSDLMGIKNELGETFFADVDNKELDETVRSSLSCS